MPSPALTDPCPSDSFPLVLDIVVGCSEDSQRCQRLLNCCSLCLSENFHAMRLWHATFISSFSPHPFYPPIILSPVRHCFIHNIHNYPPSPSTFGIHWFAFYYILYHVDFLFWKYRPFAIRTYVTCIACFGNTYTSLPSSIPHDSVLLWCRYSWLPICPHLHHCWRESSCRGGMLIPYEGGCARPHWKG